MVYQAGMVFLGLLEWQERRETRDHLDLKVNGQVVTQSFFTPLDSLCRDGADTQYMQYLINPLPTMTPFGVRFWPHVISWRNQLAQSVLKIGSALAERVVGCTALPDSAWWWLQLPVEKPWSMACGPLVCFLAQTGAENAPFTL